MDNPDAPLSHHWQDSTHVTFGVVTLGAVWRDLKIEGSTARGGNRMKCVTILISRSSIRSAGGSPGIQPGIWRCKFRTAISRARKSWSRMRTGTAPRRRSYIIGRSVPTRTGRTRLSGDRIATVVTARRSHSWLRRIISAGAIRSTPVSSTSKNRGTSSSLTRSIMIECLPINAYTAGYVRDLTHGRGIDVGLRRANHDQ